MKRHVAAPIAVIAVALALAGCGSDDQSAAGPRASVSPSVSASKARLVSTTSATGFGYCGENGEFLLVRGFKVEGGELRAGLPSAGDPNVVNEAWYAPVPAGTMTVATSAILFGSDSPGKDLAKVTNWAQRKKLAGATLVPGEYASFIKVSMTAGSLDATAGSVDTITLPWVALDGRAGEDVSRWGIRFAEKC